MKITGLTPKGRWVLDTFRAVLRDGGTREEALSEVNRLLDPEWWAAAVERGEIPVWRPPTEVDR